jgi:hypothetical protein
VLLRHIYFIHRCVNLNPSSCESYPDHVCYLEQGPIRRNYAKMLVKKTRTFIYLKCLACLYFVFRNALGVTIPTRVERTSLL